MTRLSVREYAKNQWIPETPGLEGRLETLGKELKKTLRTRSNPLTILGRRVLDGRSEIKVLAREITGIIPVGDDIIEIQPKFLTQTENGSWRESLLAILARTRGLEGLPRIVGGVVPESFADLIGLVVAAGLTQAIHDGIPRSYVQRREDSAVFKGKFDAGRAWRTALDPTRIPVVFDDFSADTVTMRLLLWAASTLSRTVVSADLRNELDHLVSMWHDIPPVKPSPFDIDNILVPIQFSFLEDSVRAAGILASGDFLGMNDSGAENSFGFIWKTETIFEEFVLEVCRGAAGYMGADADKMSTSVLLDPVDGPHVKTRVGGGAAVTGFPDVVVHRRGMPVAILDAKYKTLSKVSSRSAGAPTASDVYQVVFYASQVGLESVALVYPAQAGLLENRHWQVEWSGNSVSENRPKLVYAFGVDLSKMASNWGFVELVQEMKANIDLLVK